MKTKSRFQLIQVSFALWLSFLTCDILASTETVSKSTLVAYPNEELLMDAGELHDLISGNKNEVFIIDMRASGFEAGHIPGAISIPGHGVLSDPDHSIQNYLMRADQFSDLMGKLGVTSETDLVIYDEGGGLGATRLFYALERFGHKGSIKILNGGLAAWNYHNYPLESGKAADKTPVAYRAMPVEERICDVTYISERLGSDNFVLFDARSAEEYDGSDRRAARGGKIPGAVNIEWNRTIAEKGIPYFLPESEIAEILSDYGITPEKEVIPYCQSNVRGAHVYFTLRLMGYDSVRPYEGSWAEYGNLENVPIE